MRNNWMLILLAVALVLAMVFTVMTAENRSRHGYGALDVEGAPPAGNYRATG